MNYNFTDMNNIAHSSVTSANQLIYNDVNIDKTLSDINCDIITLNVTGRAALEYNINTVTPDGIDGELFQSATLKARTLQIEMLISAKDNATLRKKYEQLNKMFSKREIVSIRFSDEIDRVYYGIYTASDNPKEDSNEQIFNIDILCTDPFKYSDVQTISYSSSAILSILSDFPVKPYIEVEYSGVGTTLDIINTKTKKGIKLVGLNPSVEKIYKIDVLENRITKSNLDTNALTNLNITSDWEEFDIKTGDQVTFLPEPSKITIKYRGVFL